jgi:hypothetical protein
VREGFAMRLRALLVAAGLLWPVSVFSGPTGFDVHYFVTGNELFGLCTDSGAASHNFCTGYVEGVVDAILVMNALKTSGLSTGACLQEKVTVDQVRDVVMQYLTAHPERRQQAAAGEALWALQAGFPCK